MSNDPQMFILVDVAHVLRVGLGDRGRDVPATFDREERGFEHAVARGQGDQHGARLQHDGGKDTLRRLMRGGRGGPGVPATGCDRDATGQGLAARAGGREQSPSATRHGGSLANRCRRPVVGALAHERPAARSCSR